MHKDVVLKIYLSGPMNKTKENAFGWRDELKKELGSAIVSIASLKPKTAYHTKVEFFDPCERWYEDKSEILAISRFIVDRDLAEIDASDIVIANVNELGTGTPMEVFYSYRMAKKFVICIFDSKNDRVLSPWIKENSHVIVNDLYEAARFIIENAADFARIK